MNNFYTLSFSETSKGWPSFFSYGPEQCLGLNNFFYSFKGGNLFRHNSNSVNRGTFYGVQSASSIKTVFNEAPLEVKLYKTIELQASPSAWAVVATAESPMADFPDGDPQFDSSPNSLKADQGGAKIDVSEFEMKEGAWYAYLRNGGASPNTSISAKQYGLRAIKGIGTPIAPSAGPPQVGVIGAGTNTCTIDLPITTPISDGLSVGDFLYQDSNNIGELKSIAKFIDNGVHISNRLTINNDTAVYTSLTAAQDNVFVYFVQNTAAESHGLTGHYLDVTLSTIANGPIELFAVQSDIMKSYP